MKLCRIFTLGLLALLVHVFTDTAASTEEDQSSENAIRVSSSQETTESTAWYSTPISSLATATSDTSTTAASTQINTTTTTTTTPRVPSEEELEAQSLLNETQGIIDSTQLHLYQRKTKLSLIFVNKAIPVLQEIKNNMSNLLKASASHSYTSFIEADGVLETELNEVENGMKRSRESVDRYTSVYNVMAEKIREVHGTLGEILLPGANDNSVTNPDSDLSSTLIPQSVPVNTEPVIIGTASDCGGIRTGSTGSISYKNGQALSPNEGCLWVIESLGSSLGHYAFKMRSAGFTTTSTTFLSIGYFNNSQYGEADAFIWKKLVPGSDTYDVVVEAHVAFVHFVSSTPQSVSATAKRGFLLEFQRPTLSGTSTTSSSIYTNEFIRGPRGTRRYPQSGNYTNNERTAIVLQPTLPRSVLQLNWWDFEGSNIDTLSIWSFGPDFTWGRQAILGGNRTTSFTARFPHQGPRNDPFLLSFKSDHSVVYDGFEFEWGPQ